MPGDSHPDLSQAGRVLVVGPPERRPAAVAAVEQLGLAAAGFDDPYAAMAELSRRPRSAAALLLSLHGLYREELQLIPAAKRAYPETEVWLTDIDARPAALAEAMRLGADGLLGEDGLHRLGGSRAAAAPAGGYDLTISSSRANVTPDGGEAGEDNGDGRSSPRVADRVERVSGQNGPTPRVPARSAATRDDRDGPVTGRAAAAPQAASAGGGDDDEPYGSAPGEPILTADELRALLQDQPDASPVSRPGVAE